MRTIQADASGMTGRAEWAVPDDESTSATSFFEFWPTWSVYLPVVVQWLGLAIFYRSLTLPLIANPGLSLSGMVGVPKSDLLRNASGACKESVLPWVRYQVSDSAPEVQAEECEKLARSSHINLPFVCKPDIGCRGIGIKLIKRTDQLADVIAKYPAGSAFLIQQLASFEPEAGVFFVKMPGESKGKVTSLTFKYSPYVVGDNSHTLGQLVSMDKRAGSLLHLYQSRHRKDWNRVLDQNEKVRLVFSASHCRGAVFRDARKHITPKLTAAIDDVFRGLPEFYYGRLDLKFPSLEDLREGKNLQILEVNGASAESIHIWDKEASLLDAVSTLTWQYKTLFKLGNAHRKRGFKPPGFMTLVRHWWKERRLSKHYPETD